MEKDNNNLQPCTATVCSSTQLEMLKMWWAEPFETILVWQFWKNIPSNAVAFPSKNSLLIPENTSAAAGLQD